MQLEQEVHSLIQLLLPPLLVLALLPLVLLLQLLLLLRVVHNTAPQAACGC
jgi:hypothetical protein